MLRYQNNDILRNTVYLSIGSNLGDRENNCRHAIGLLREQPQIAIVRMSRLLETKALTLDGKPQPDYLNGVLELKTTLTPQELLKVCKTIETQLGRQPSKNRWQARPIDLDILLFEGEALKTPELTIPHPEIRNRPFLAQLLKELTSKGGHPERSEGSPAKTRDPSPPKAAQDDKGDVI